MTEHDANRELVAEGDAAALCPELEALVLAGGIPCPPAPGWVWVWVAEAGVARCIPWTDPSEEGAGLRQRFERVLAARGPALFPVLVQTPERTALIAMEQSLFRPAEGVSPDQSIHELAGHLVRAGHDSAAPGRVVVAEAVPYEDVPGAYKVRVTSATPDDLSAEQRQSLEAMPVPATASATGVLITLQPPGQAALVCALSVSRPTDTGVSPAITARFLAGGFPCPAPPGHLWVSLGGAKPVCVPWSAVPLIAACLRAQAEELLAVRGPGWFPVYLERDGSGEFAVLDGALFLSDAADPGATAEELAGILALAGHAEAVPPGQVIVCDAALLPDGLPGVLPGARTVHVCYDPPEAISPRGQEALAGVAPFLAKGLAPALLQIQVDAANAVVGAVVIGATTVVAKPDATTDPEEG